MDRLIEQIPRFFTASNVMMLAEAAYMTLAITVVGDFKVQRAKRRQTQLNTVLVTVNRLRCTAHPRQIANTAAAILARIGIE